MDNQIQRGWWVAVDSSGAQSDGLWLNVCHYVRRSSSAHSRHVALLPYVHLLSATPDRVLVAVKSAEIATAVRAGLEKPLHDAFAEHLGGRPQLVITTDSSLESAPPSFTPPPAPEAARQTTIDLTAVEATSQVSLAAGRTPTSVPRLGPASGSTAAPPTPEPASPRRRDKAPAADFGPTRLNAKFTFETFVAGQSNRMARAAALAVAENPAGTYNPLFVYGHSGLGKTHLLHAIGWEALAMNPAYRVRYVNSEEFTNEFINAIRDESFPKFQHRYRDVDYLLIDDIQFLSGKEETQEAFFHTFNALHNNNKQVVITSDLPPKQLTGFEDRMKSRFEWGLIADVQPPSLETRFAILRMKAQAERFDVEPEVLMYIAERVSNNIRNLEGALTLAMAWSNLDGPNRGRPVSLEDVEQSLRHVVDHEDSSPIGISAILAQVSDFYGVSIEDITGTSRSRKLVDARQIAMYISRDLTDLSLPKIGAEFGNRDHSTVVHAIKKVKERIQKEHRVFDEINELTHLIRNGHRS